VLFCLLAPLIALSGCAVPTNQHPSSAPSVSAHPSPTPKAAAITTEQVDVGDHPVVGPWGLLAASATEGAATLFTAQSTAPVQLNVLTKPNQTVAATLWAIELDSTAVPRVSAVSDINTAASGLTADSDRINVQTFGFDGKPLGNVDLDPNFSATDGRPTNGQVLVNGALIMELRSESTYSIISVDAITGAQNWRMDSTDESASGGTVVAPSAQVVVADWHGSTLGLNPKDGSTLWSTPQVARSAIDLIGSPNYFVRARSVFSALTGASVAANITSYAYDPVSANLELGYFSQYETQRGGHEPSFQTINASGKIAFEILFDDPSRVTAILALGAFDGRSWLLGAAKPLVVDSVTGELDASSPPASSASATTQSFSVPVAGSAYWTLLKNDTVDAYGNINTASQQLIRHPSGQIAFGDL
jgi:PQQ-like domain